MKFKSKNPPQVFTEKPTRNVDIFRCKFCGELQGCSENGEVGMYSYKILRLHEKNCKQITPTKYKELK